jgi:hypothetical protein
LNLREGYYVSILKKAYTHIHRKKKANRLFARFILQITFSLKLTCSLLKSYSMRFDLICLCLSQLWLVRKWFCGSRSIQNCCVYWEMFASKEFSMDSERTSLILFYCRLNFFTSNWVLFYLILTKYIQNYFRTFWMPS